MFIKKLKIFSLFILLLNPNLLNALNDFTNPKEMEELYKTNELEVLFYFNGLGAGIRVGQLIADKNDKRFCIPDDKGFSALEYYEIYRYEYLSNKTYYDNEIERGDYTPASIMMFLGFTSLYPCN